MSVELLLGEFFKTDCVVKSDDDDDGVKSNKNKISQGDDFMAVGKYWNNSPEAIFALTSIGCHFNSLISISSVNGDQIINSCFNSNSARLYNPGTEDVPNMTS